ncbi:hypothetical protein [Sporosarcina sp. P33]|uniref:hypothetical protein n=1 Tax=Sporosarcina sp. P33 TaxID=1930764 RepID=UPI0009C05802|nr:hypothetical protein [Sporosarcina sp. P33]ARD47593.1 hypothetical protein SporoP33_04635 [Sporosarcina sp. P33]
MQEQLDIFSTEVEIIREQPIRIYDEVRVRAAVDDDDVETFYYLQEYEGRKGLVVKRVSRKLNQYEVEFQGKERNGIFKAEELLVCN